MTNARRRLTASSVKPEDGLRKRTLDRDELEIRHVGGRADRVHPRVSLEDDLFGVRREDGGDARRGRAAFRSRAARKSTHVKKCLTAMGNLDVPGYDTVRNAICGSTFDTDAAGTKREVAANTHVMSYKLLSAAAVCTSTHSATAPAETKVPLIQV